MEKAEYKPWFLKMNLRDIWKKRAVTCQGEKIVWVWLKLLVPP